MSSTMAISCTTPFLQPLSNYKGLSNNISERNQILSPKSGFIVPSRPTFSCSVSMADGQSGDCEKLELEHIMNKAKRYWDQAPQPIKSFPWNTVLDSFIQQILDVAATVIKYLSAPLLAVSTLSEMSYCAHERKLFFLPVPLILVFVVAGILKQSASELLPITKDANAPWHLITIVAVFALLKLPGPSYPYWARICIPHFANGGLLRIFWMIYSWYQMPERRVGAKLQQSVESV